MSEPMTDEQLSRWRADLGNPPRNGNEYRIGDLLDEIDRLRAEVKRLETDIDRLKRIYNL